MERECLCKAQKQFLLEFDGGAFGAYRIRVCKECNSNIDKSFLLKEEKI